MYPCFSAIVVLWLIHPPLLLAKVTTTDWVPQTEGAETTIPSRCTHGENIAIPKDCHYYYYCAYGFLVRRECSPIGYVFSRSKGYCVPAYSPSNDCGLEIATESAATTKACISGLLYQNPANCGSYFLCYSGTFIQKYCSQNRVYSSLCQRCVDPGSAYSDCPSHATTTAIKTTVKTTTPAVIKPSPESIAAVIRSGDHYRSPEDCSIYYVCQHGILVQEQCYGDQVFSKSRGTCVYRNSVSDDCVQITITATIKATTEAFGTMTPSCTPGMLFPDSDDCQYYYDCTFNHTLIKKKCNPGHVFSYFRKRCVTKGSIGDDCTPATSTTIKTTEAFGTMTPSCTPGMLFPDSDDCQYYYDCTFNHTLIKKKCNPGHVFSYFRKRCVTKGSIGDDCTPATSTTTIKTTEVPTSEPIGIMTPTCTPGDSFPDPDDCHSYLHCTFSHTLIKKKCHPGHVFSQSKKHCVSSGSINDDCTPGVETTSICKYGETVPDERSCNAYYICYSGKLSLKFCPIYSTFSRNRGHCVPQDSYYNDCQFHHTSLSDHTYNPPAPSIFTSDPAVPALHQPVAQHLLTAMAFYLAYLLGNKHLSLSPVSAGRSVPVMIFVFAASTLAPVTEAINEGDSCIDHSVHRDPIDCKIYYICEFRRMEQKYCPTNMVYSKRRRLCVYTGSVYNDCSPQVTDSVTSVNGITDTVMPITPIIDSDPLTTVTTETTPLCTPGDSSSDPDDCQSYKYCTPNRTLIKKKCPADKVFSRAKKRCVTRGSSFDDCSTVIDSDPLTTVTTETTPLCTPGDSSSDPDDCQSYKYCTPNRTLIKKKCPADKVFSRAKKRCVTRASRFDDCSIVAGSATPITFSIETTVLCTPGDIFPDPKDCQYYCHCTYQLTVIKKKCLPEQVFSSSKKRCVFKGTSDDDCSQALEKKVYPCTPGDSLPDPDDCQSYYHCTLSRTVIKKDCPADKVFSRSKKRCVTKGSSFDDCSLVFTTESTETTASLCTPGESLPDPDDCRSYYYCTFSRTVIKKDCPTDKVYSRSKKLCVMKGSSFDDCSLVITTESSRKPKEYPTDDHKPKGYPTDYPIVTEDDNRKPKEYPTDDRKPKKYPTDDGKPKEYPTDNHKPKKYPTDDGKPKEYPTDNHKPKKYPTDDGKPKEYPTDNHKPKKYPTDDGKPKEYPTDYRKPKEYPTDYRKPKEYPTDDYKPKKYPTDDRKPKGYPTDYPIVTEDDYPKPKEYPTDYSMVTEVEYRKPKEYPTDYRKPKKYPTDDRKPKEYPTDYPIVTEDDYSKAKEYATDYSMVTEVDYPKATDYSVVTKVASKKECVPGQTEPNHYNCSSYYTCSDERFQLKYCTIGQVYSSFKKNCVKQYGYYDDCSTS
ncbi:hypothetical protein CHS0354_022427 [Potamilus streckersoni]|uniref:Chitin-binding type-2 domain-containing protein n=1 Tax=Potamilus streckersoni TaxID=2493646 RepID=A0AAE0SX58_9BIVA|nr:hypothetical protein CHS0354_022427 [Potamilus streckersoni]